jgi:hypothetical protein
MTAEPLVLTTKRNYWPVLLIAIPFAAVLFGIFMVTVALWFPDDLVVDDYYKDGMAINQNIDKQLLATELGVKASLVFLSSERVVFKIENVIDNSVQLALRHVTDSERDQLIMLQAGVTNEYVADGQILGMLKDKGVWYLELSGQDERWKVGRRIETPIVDLEINAGG